jgi:quercetin dioxygenase-like cupin family protein
MSTCSHTELTSAYAIRALSSSDMPAAEKHINSCSECQRELAMLRPAARALAMWPADVLIPKPSLQERLARRIAEETGAEVQLPAKQVWIEPEWKEVAPGIRCKLLAANRETHEVAMLVRLAPGASYPAHTHAGLEELHLLDGELWIDERKLYAGDYNRGEPGASDHRVWTETGCTCLLITSTKDVLR